MQWATGTKAPRAAPAQQEQPPPHLHVQRRLLLAAGRLAGAALRQHGVRLRVSGGVRTWPPCRRRPPSFELCVTRRRRQASCDGARTGWCCRPRDTRRVAGAAAAKQSSPSDTRDPRAVRSAGHAGDVVSVRRGCAHAAEKQLPQLWQPRELVLAGRPAASGRRIMPQSHLHAVSPALLRASRRGHVCGVSRHVAAASQNLSRGAHGHPMAALAPPPPGGPLT